MGFLKESQYLFAKNADVQEGGETASLLNKDILLSIRNEGV